MQKQLNRSRCHLGWEFGCVGPRNNVLDGDSDPNGKGEFYGEKGGPLYIQPGLTCLNVETRHLWKSNLTTGQHCVRWGPISASAKRGTPPEFSAHVCCGQTAELMKMLLGTKVGIGPGDIVLDGDPATLKGHSPQFSAHVCCGQTAAHLSYCWALVGYGNM